MNDYIHFFYYINLLASYMYDYNEFIKNIKKYNKSSNLECNQHT